MTITARPSVQGRSSQEAMFLEVVDDYYPDPLAVRKFALECTFEPPFTGQWKGLHSLQRHPDTRRVFFDIAERLPVDGEANWADIEASYAFWGRPSAGMFALLLDGQTDNVHFHQRSGAWAAVCYLSLPEDCQAGIGFYRHETTGRTSSHESTQEERELFRADAHDREKWTRITTVEMAFNRLVIFDGRYFHAADDGFGAGPSDGRLAQLFNMNLD
jgi:uncharacterized protein DUF6445